MMKFSLSSVLLGGMLLLAPVALRAVDLQKVATTHGASEGPTVVLVVPHYERAKTMTAARQLAAMEIPKGTLSVYEYMGDPTNSQSVHGALAQFEDAADYLVAVAHDLAPLAKSDRVRPPILSSSNPGDAADLLAEALAASYPDGVPELPALMLQRDNATILHFSPEDTVRSRIDRWTRLYVLNLLEMEGMAPEPGAVADAMSQGPFNFALYDAEGVGGSGPVRMEAIVNVEDLNATVTYVCPEDIQEGVLPEFSGVLFPGGSGKGIATALEELGQEEVRRFVRAGGGYVGICAGAYLPTCRIDGYLRMVGVYHNQPWAKGGGMVDVELTEEGEKIFGGDFLRFATRYNNGPVFGHEEGLEPTGDFAPVTELATFRSATTNSSRDQESTEMIGKEAITSTVYGNGRMLLISPHPESHEELFPMVGRGLLWSIKQHPDVDGKTETSAL